MAVLFALSAAACSTDNYAGPVENFAGASRNAEEALRSLNDEVTTGYANQVRALAASGAGLVLIDEENCLATSERCQLTVLKADGSEVHYPPDPALANMTVVMAGIRAYADHLTDIIKADTAAQVTDNVNATFGSIQSLATLVATHSGEGTTVIPDLAEPAGAAANWLVGQYVENVKLDGLRRATASAQPVVADAADLFEVTSQVAMVQPKALLAENVSERMDAFDDAGGDANLERLVAAAAAYDTFLLAKPSQVFASLRDAHNALAASLNDGSVTLASATAKIQVFAAEAEALATIMKDLSSAVAAASGGDE